MPSRAWSYNKYLVEFLELPGNRSEDDLEHGLIEHLKRFLIELSVRFSHDGYLAGLTGLRNQLKAALSGTPAEPGLEMPSASELAERIKPLKGAHTIESAPERIGVRTKARIEEPMTARIRLAATTGGREARRGNLAERAADFTVKFPSGSVVQLIAFSTP